jgi:hypothetical protein
MLHIRAGVKTLSYSDIGVNGTPYVTYKGRGKNLILHRYRGECLMLHIGAGVKTLSYTDIGVNALCYA